MNHIPILYVVLLCHWVLIWLLFQRIQRVDRKLCDFIEEQCIVEPDDYYQIQPVRGCGEFPVKSGPALSGSGRPSSVTIDESGSHLPKTGSY